MIAASLVKELKLLSRDLHGLAVLFVMPITFMLIMSVALSRDADPHHGSRIALVGVADDAVNKQFAAGLAKDDIQVTLMQPEKLDDAQSGLHDRRFQLVLHNPNRAADKLADSKPLQVYVAPDTEPSWLAAVKGVLQQHYTETRINAYFDNSGITIDNKKLPAAIRQDIQKKIDEKNAEQLDAVSAFLGKPMLEEHYLSAGSGAVAKPNAVQHSVPAWLIFGMFFIMIPLSNVMALERQTNTITRLRLARAGAAGLIAAKLVPYFLINQLQFAGMLLLGRYLLPEIGVSALMLNGSLVCRRIRRRARLRALHQRVRQIHRTRRGAGRRRHHPDGGARRHYGTRPCDARNHAAHHLGVADGMGLESVSGAVAQPQRFARHLALSRAVGGVCSRVAGGGGVGVSKAVADAG